MKNQLAFLLLGWFFLLSLPAQHSSKEVDSLTALLDRTPPDKQRVELLNALSKKLRGKAHTSAIQYAEEARILAHKLSYPQGLGNAYLNKGWALAGTGASDSAEWYYQMCLTFAQEKGLEETAAWAHMRVGEHYVFRNAYRPARRHLLQAEHFFGNKTPSEALVWVENAWGLYYAFQNAYDSSNIHFKKEYTLAGKIQIPRAQAAAMGNMGINFSKLEQLDSSLHFYYQALEIDEQIGNQRGLASNYLNIGNIYDRQGKVPQAEEAYLKSLEIARTIQFKRNIGNCLNVLGELYRDRKEYDKALAYFNESLAIKKEIGNERAYTNSLWNKAKLFQLQGRFDEALAILDTCIAIRERLAYQSGLAGAYLLKGETFMEMGNYSIALPPLLKSLEYAEEIASLPRQRDGAKALSDCYAKLEKYAKAFQYQSFYAEARDSLLNEAKIRQVLEVEAKYNSQKKQAEISNLQAEKALQDLNIQKQQTEKNRLYWGILLLIFVGIASFFLYRIRQRQRIQQKEWEREREQMERLKQIDKIKDQFLANTSHELRTPLHGMVGMAESLLGQTPDLEQQNNLEMLIASGRRLSAMVNDLLDFSLLKNEDLQLHLRPVDMYTLSDLVLHSCRTLLKGKPIALINNIEKDLHPVHADENRLQQVLYNLIGNAIKFTEEGRIILGVEQGDSKPFITFFVQDSGIGIPQDKQEQIFEEFEQVDGSLSRAYGGAGLGLSISRQLIEQQGGKLWVESQPQLGSTFFFTLPVAKEKLSSTSPSLLLTHNSRTQQEVLPPSEAQHQPISSREPSSHKVFQILIVDDEPINHKVLENYLSNGPYRLEFAMNGSEALEKIQSNPFFDLVLLDIMMPKISGYELCKQLRQTYLASELPIILVTAKNQVEELVHGLDIGANDYLSKPFSKDEFLARVRTHLNLHTIHRATGKFVPNEFLKALGRSTITEVKLGDQIEREVTIFFSDIRDYTSLAERLSPKETFSLINTYTYRLGPIIRSKSGFITNYLGDGIVALFPKTADQALEAAVDMQRAIAQLNEERKSTQLSSIRVGMGLHTGPLVMGIIGDEERNEAATISDTMNTASRIEGLTKYFESPLLFSGETLLKLQHPDNFSYRFLGHFQLKGKRSSVSIYECLNALPEKQRMRKLELIDIFQTGLAAYYKQNFYDAIDAFHEVLAKDPADTPSKIMKDKSIHMLTAGVPTDWNGIEVLDSK